MELTMNDNLENHAYIKQCMEEIIKKELPMFRVIDSGGDDVDNSRITFYLSYEDFRNKFQDYPEMLEKLKEFENNGTI